MKKKLLSLIMAGAMAASLMAGCGVSTDTGAGSGSDSTGGDTASTETSDTSEATGDEEEITWAFWDDLNASQDLMTQTYKDTVDRFNETYKGKYHLNVVTTNLEEYDSKVNALVAAGNTPDLLICNPGPNADVYVNSNVVQPINQYLDADPDWKNSFSGGMFDRITYGDDIYGVPTNFAAALCFYNTELFEKAGITEVPKDMDGFIAACDKLKAFLLSFYCLVPFHDCRLLHEPGRRGYKSAEQRRYALDG